MTRAVLILLSLSSSKTLGASLRILYPESISTTSFLVTPFGQEAMSLRMNSLYPIFPSV